MMNSWRLLLILLSLSCLTSQAWGFSYRGQSEGNFTGPTSSGAAVSWHQRQVTMGLNFGPEWNDSARLALQQWNEAGADFEWHASDNSAQPCVNDGINSTGWADSTCGSEWGSIIATTRVSMSRIGGTWYINDTDVIFNSGLQFDSYSGPLRRDANGRPVYDFIRVALHEFGHAAGLLHPDESNQDVNSIMNTGHKSLSLDRLQDDDIQAIRHIYSDAQGDPLDITLEGFRQFAISGQLVNINVDYLRSYRNSASQALTLEVHASPSGNSNDNYILSSFALEQLDATEQRYIGKLTGDYTSPPAGLHSLTLVLLEAQSAAPLYSQAIGYIEIESNSLEADTQASQTNNSADAGSGGGGSLNGILLLILSGLAIRRLTSTQH